MNIFKLNDSIDEDSYTNDQINALKKCEEFLNSDEKYFLLSGFAGSGKTSIIENILKYSNGSVLAPTNTAVKRLREKINLPNERFETIHSCIYGSPDPYTGEWIPKSIERNRTYIIDESSMISIDIFNDILSLSSENNNKIIFVGDSYQIEPVGKDPELFKWNEKYSCFNPKYKVLMSEVKRTDNGILTVSNDIRVNSYNRIIANKDVEVVKKFGKLLKECIINNKNYVIIVATNKSRMKWNATARKLKKFESIVNSGEKVMAVANNRLLNSEIVYLQNPKLVKTFKDVKVNIGTERYPNNKMYDMHLVIDSNRTILFIPELDIPSLHGPQLVEAFQDDEMFVNTTNFGKRWNKNVDICTYAYAITTHKAQGQEYDYVFIDVNWLHHDWNHSRWWYTAVSRGKKYVQIKESEMIK